MQAVEETEAGSEGGTNGGVPIADPADDARGFDLPPKASTSQVTTLSKTARRIVSKQEGKKGKAGEAGQPLPSGESKGAWRILNAEKVRNDYNAARKRKREEEASGSEKLVLMPHETLKAFNARVEASMRSSINSAFSTGSKATNKRVKQEAEEAAEKWRAKKAAKAARRKAERDAAKEDGEFTGIDDAAIAAATGKPLKIKKPAAPAAPERVRATEFEPVSYTRPLSEQTLLPPTLPVMRRALKSEDPERVTGRMPILGEGIKEAMERERLRVVEEYRKIKEAARKEREDE